MANICSNSVVITGPLKTIKVLRKRIDEQDPTLVKDPGGECGHFETGMAYGLMDVLPLPDNDSDCISVCITSKWGPPVDDFLNLSKVYPDLTIEIEYEEPAMEVYGKVQYRGGKCTLDQPMKPFEYLSENNEEFADEISFIEDSTAEEFRKTYIEATDWRNDPVWESYGCYLEPLLVKRATLAYLVPLLDVLQCDDSIEAAKKRLVDGK